MKATQPPAGPSASPAPDTSEHLHGTLAALASFCIWGLLVLYWKQLHHLAALEQMSHRIVWSAVALVPLVLLGHARNEILATLRSWACMVRLMGSAAMLGVNWYLFIWAVENNRVLDSSLGYFINPLVNAALGWLFLRERTGRLQALGVALAATGVAISVVAYGDVPFLALSMALTFSLYGFIRKTTKAGAIAGLFVETLFMLPVGLVLLYNQYSGSVPVPDTKTLLILACSGPLTLLPLTLFTYAAKRVRFITLGLTQYASPTISFLLGVFVYHEVLKTSSLITFGFIWAGLAVFSYASWRAHHELVQRLKMHTE